MTPTDPSVAKRQLSATTLRQFKVHSQTKHSNTPTQPNRNLQTMPEARLESWPVDDLREMDQRYMETNVSLEGEDETLWLRNRSGNARVLAIRLETSTRDDTPNSQSRYFFVLS